MYPAIGAAGPCQVAVNFGQQEFLFSPGKEGHWLIEGAKVINSDGIYY